MAVSILRSVFFPLLLASFSVTAATFTWTGVRCPGKISQGDGISGYPNKIGTFTLLQNKEEWGQFVFNVNNRFPQSKPWATWAVGAIPENITPLTEQKHNEYLSYMDQLGVTIFLELIPTNQNVLTLINDNLTKYGSHPCVAGIGVDLEYYSGSIDAKAWDDKAKSFKSTYRFYFKHWETGKMPAYRGKGDFIYICTSSESPIADLNTAFAAWAKAFAPSAVAFQIGYPSDEDAENGTRGGWGVLSDPIKDWGNSLLTKIGTTTQEIGMLWVTVKSGKSYNTAWNLTKGATLPSTMTVPWSVQESAVNVGETALGRFRINAGAGPVGAGDAITNMLGQRIGGPGRTIAPGALIFRIVENK